MKKKKNIVDLLESTAQRTIESDAVISGKACAHLSALTHHNFPPVATPLSALAFEGVILHHTHTLARYTPRGEKNLPFGRNVAEITKIEREIARDPLPVIAMLDTCLRLAALNHLETAMG